MKELNPAEFVTHKFGGVRQTARILGLSHAAVSKWCKVGRIPSEHYEKILQYAKVIRVRVSPTNLVVGGKVALKKKGS